MWHRARPGVWGLPSINRIGENVVRTNPSEGVLAAARNRPIQPLCPKTVTREPHRGPPPRRHSRMLH